MFKLFFYFIAIPSLLSSTADSNDCVGPSGIWWTQTSKLTVKETIHLTKDLELSADEIIILGKIITNGHRLNIEAHHLTFAKNASIESFANVAPNNDVPGPVHKAPAATGIGVSGKGKDGAGGLVGLKGLDGYGAVEEFIPGEISIFAGKVHGQITILANGQKGGRGGTGGQGQSGGDGSQGSHAQASLLTSKAAGRGGKGGTGGKGGRGGVGGSGGVQVPVALLTSKKLDNRNAVTKIENKPGEPGDGGLPGDYGNAGKCGPGGNGDIYRKKVGFVFTTTSEPMGPVGELGDPCPHDKERNSAAYIRDCTQGVGIPGKQAPRFLGNDWLKRIRREEPSIYLEFPDFEKERCMLHKSWYETHWWTAFYVVARRSIELAHDRMEPQEINDPLIEVFGDEVNLESLKIIARRFEHGFLSKLEASLSAVKGRDIALAQRLQEIIDTSRPMISFFYDTAKKGSFSADDTGKFETVLKQIQEKSEIRFSQAAKQCADYARQVLADHNYKKYLLGRQTHFEIPVCLNVDEIDFETLANGTFSLAHSLAPSPSIQEIPQIELEFLKPDEQSLKTSFFDFLKYPIYYFWNSLFASRMAMAEDSNRPKQNRINSVWFENDNFHLLEKSFAPQSDESVKLGALGTHKGYQVPNPKEITMHNLSTVLAHLNNTVESVCR